MNASKAINDMFHMKYSHVACAKAYHAMCSMDEAVAWLNKSQNANDYRIVDINREPQYAILDVGCTRSMSSWNAMSKFMSVAEKHGVKFRWIKSNVMMSFANSQKTLLEWAVEITFPGSELSTRIDIHPTGDVPILISLPQMMNLGMSLHMRPSAVYMTCKVLESVEVPLVFTTSKHVAIDLLKLCFVS